ncbi:hypothetical protein [Desulfopila sp. IMCC35008]|uniref:hypothetical protein n=1 Tax=Desulfopila sp. IMCC35008 TaxID=2653858 RepID=UPI001F1005CC|nr:hypothetical protein [Desulfopila sp. IMCC35008]
MPIHYDVQHLLLTPSETVRRFTMNGWRRVLGFHTDVYLHCAHREVVLGAAREAGAAVFLHPVADLSHPGNLDYYTLIRCYQAFTEIFPANMVELGLTPFSSRKAGPREALWRIWPGRPASRWCFSGRSYPEIVDELQCFFPPRFRQGFTIFLNGLSGSGKSTIARVLLVKFMEMCDRPLTPFFVPDHCHFSTTHNSLEIQGMHLFSQLSFHSWSIKYTILYVVDKEVRLLQTCWCNLGN